MTTTSPRKGLDRVAEWVILVRCLGDDDVPRGGPRTRPGPARWRSLARRGGRAVGRWHRHPQAVAASAAGDRAASPRSRAPVAPPGSARPSTRPCAPRSARTPPPRWPSTASCGRRRPAPGSARPRGAGRCSGLSSRATKAPDRHRTRPGGAGGVVGRGGVAGPGRPRLRRRDEDPYGANPAPGTGAAGRAGDRGGPAPPRSQPHPPGGVDPGRHRPQSRRDRRRRPAGLRGVRRRVPRPQLASRASGGLG